MEIKAVLFDLIGTTVKEDDPNVIMKCFEKAFTDNHILFDAELIKAGRGSQFSNAPSSTQHAINWI